MTRLVPFLALLASAQAAFAQQLTGSVVDSVSRRPIAGAVVLLLDGSGSTLARTVTDERGRYFLPATAGAQRTRLLRLGYRPRETPIANGELAMLAIPLMLETVRAVANPSCPRRNDSNLAFALWQQARSALLATVVAREANAGNGRLLMFEQVMNGATDNIVVQKVLPDSGTWAMFFGASFDANVFAANGFTSFERGERYFHGPDADILLDDAFQSAYCFSIAARERSRPTQVGLRFTPAREQRNRVDIDGVLWIDTVSRSMNDIEFRYLGLSAAINRYRPSGHVSFREMPNGTVLVDKWFIRTVGSNVDTLRRGAGRSAPGDWGGVEIPGRGYRVTRGGGVIARIDWANGTTWRATLGKLRVRVVDSEDRPVRGVILRLDSTHYHAMSDSTGHVEIDELLPGPYKVSVQDSIYRKLGVFLNKPIPFTAVTDSTVELTYKVMTESQLVTNTCARPSGDWQAMLVLARVVTPEGTPLRGAEWSIGSVRGQTRADGLFTACLKGRFGETATLEVVLDDANGSGKWRKTVPLVLSRPLTVVRVEIP